MALHGCANGFRCARISPTRVASHRPSVHTSRRKSPKIERADRNCATIRAQFVNLVRRAALKLLDSVESILKHKGSEVYSIAPEVTVYEALEQMADKDIGALVVMDGSDVVGVLSERDYARKVFLQGRSSREMKVREIMSSPVVTVNLKTTVDECMYRMTDKRCRHLPVVEEGRIVGVVSIGDLVNWIMTAQDLTIHQLEDYITGKYPG